jgi:hypothetical protein
MNNLALIAGSPARESDFRLACFRMSASPIAADATLVWRWRGDWIDRGAAAARLPSSTPVAAEPPARGVYSGDENEEPETPCRF